VTKYQSGAETSGSQRNNFLRLYSIFMEDVRFFPRVPSVKIYEMKTIIIFINISKEKYR